MSGKVIERTKGKNRFEYDDIPSTFEKAEKIAGKRLDRRGSYCILDGEVLRLEKWTSACSGCTPDDPYITAAIGHGCRECGGTGKRRMSYFLPIFNKQKAKGGE